MSNKPYPVTIELTEAEARYINENMVRKAEGGSTCIADVVMSCTREMIAADMEGHSIEDAARKAGV